MTSMQDIKAAIRENDLLAPLAQDLTERSNIFRINLHLIFSPPVSIPRR